MQVSLQKILYSAQWSLLVFIIYVMMGGKDSVIKMFRGMIFIGIGIVIGDYLMRSLTISVWLGWPLGCLTVCLIAWIFLMTRLLVFFPFPRCKKGKCHGIDDYFWCHGDFFGKRKWGLYWYSCRCGDKYLRRGKKFMEFIPEIQARPSPWININNGTTRPYKKLVGFRKWVDDLDS